LRDRTSPRRACPNPRRPLCSVRSSPASGPVAGASSSAQPNPKGAPATACWLPGRAVAWPGELGRGVRRPHPWPRQVILGNANYRWESHLALDEPAALIYCPFRALLHLPAWADRRRTFERVAASLRPGGQFAWNAFAFDHRIAARLDGVHQQEPVPHANHYSVGDNRIDIILDGGAKSPCGGRPKTSGSGLSMSLALKWKHSTAASPGSHSATTARSLSLSHAITNHGDGTARAHSRRPQACARSARGPGRPLARLRWSGTLPAAPRR
jgi:hypothetical protein